MTTSLSICGREDFCLQAKKRRRPWTSHSLRKRSFSRSTTMASIAFLVASSLVEGLPFFGGVSAQASTDGSTPAPNAVPIGTTISPPLVSILKKAFPLQFELVLEVTEEADVDQVIDDVDGVLELYLLENLSVFIEDNDVDVRAVDLGVTKARRLLRGVSFERRWLQTALRDLTVLVDGNIIYDIDISGCIECVDRSIDTELTNLLALGNVNEVIQSKELDGVNRVSDIRPPSDFTSQGTGDEDSTENSTGDKQSIANVVTNPSDDENELERPSVLSIAVGFALTGIAVLSLFFYAYLFCKKRRKKLRKERQQRQSIEYSMTPSKVSPDKSGQNLRSVAPELPIAAIAPKDEEDSDVSSFKGVDSPSSDEGQIDAFARELQMAASLDQKAWDDFQRKKNALEKEESQISKQHTPRNEQQDEKPPTKAQANGSKSKSFPYGDESNLSAEEGVEWTTNGSVNNTPLSGWGTYPSGFATEEKKDEWSSSGARDPDPSTSVISAENSAMMESIERTLMQYGDSRDRSTEDENLAAADVINEVNRLSRFVQRYERRKERRHHREIDQMNTSKPDVTPASGLPGGLREEAGVQNQKSNSVRKGFFNGGGKAPKRPDVDVGEGDEPPKKTAYTGITMTGEMYNSTPTYDENKQMFALSDSEEDDDTFRDDDGSLKSQRLGITPFSVQAAEDVSYDPIVPPSMQLGQPSKSLSDDEQPSTAPQYTQDISKAIRGQRTSLSDLRKGEAVIDGTQSDINVGFFPVTSTGMSQVEVAPGQSQAKVNSTPNPNPKFNKLRNIFEDRPKNAIFPPTENWQSGVTK